MSQHYGCMRKNPTEITYSVYVYVRNAAQQMSERIVKTSVVLRCGVEMPGWDCLEVIDYGANQL